MTFMYLEASTFLLAQPLNPLVALLPDSQDPLPYATQVLRNYLHNVSDGSYRSIHVKYSCRTAAP